VSARIGVIGGGLAGIAAALDAADDGAEVVLFERRGSLGGLTTSIDRNGLTFDNGQHVFLRCCTAYRAFLSRIGAGEQVRMQDRCDVPVLSPGGTRSSIRRSSLPAPLHLARSLATYRHLGVADRLRLGRAAIALRSLDPEDPSLDTSTFGEWLDRHGQSPDAVDKLWNLITLPTVNLPASAASLALATRVFREGLLDRRDAADIGWALVPLRVLHGENSVRALRAAGVEVRAGVRVTSIDPRPGGGRLVRTEQGATDVDAVIVATPPAVAAAIGAPVAVQTVEGLGSSPIVNVHLVLDRTVTDLELFAAVDSPVQFVFDRTASSGLGTGQCLAISLSAADGYLRSGARELIERFHASLGDLLPAARRARVVDGAVTREPAATFRGVPGSASLRPGAVTAEPDVFLAGAWCATGWPATMEGAVRSGRSAARAVMARVAPLPARDLVGTVR